MISLKQLFCKHRFSNVDVYEVKNIAFVSINRCVKCGKEYKQITYFPPTCKITKKFCDHEELNNCRHCPHYYMKTTVERSKYVNL